MLWWLMISVGLIRLVWVLLRLVRCGVFGLVLRGLLVGLLGRRVRVTPWGCWTRARLTRRCRCRFRLRVLSPGWWFGLLIVATTGGSGVSGVIRIRCSRSAVGGSGLLRW